LLQRLWFELRIAAVWVYLGWERLGIARDLDGGSVQDNNFTVTGTKAVATDVTLRGLIDVCLLENDRRLGLYDPRLVRPRFVPGLARFACRFLPVVAPAAA
jgi:hypothetical protein